MILGTLLFYLGGIRVVELRIPAAILAWLVVVLQWPHCAKSPRRQALTLLSIGAAALLFAYSKGIFPGWYQIFMVNLPMLGMFAAVAFLSLTTPAHLDANLPTGGSAPATTAIGTNLLGAVINLSIVLVFGDRLQRNNTLTPSQRIILARSFCAAAWWSPFFIATGAALTYAPEMHWHQTVLPGIFMSAIAILYTVSEVKLFGKEVFEGYPIRVESLFVVVTLAITVLSLHYLFPQISILNLICFVAPIGALLFMKGSPRKNVLHDFVSNRITSVTSQFMLFLAAGVFSTGLKSLTQVYPSLFSFAGMTFSPLMFAAISGVLILIGFIGVHPIIGIAIVSPLLLPLNPDHSQLGFMFLTTWAISTGSSPLSGIGLIMVSRYHASPSDMLKCNYHYTIAMWLIASLVNWIYFG